MPGQMQGNGSTEGARSRALSYLTRKEHSEREVRAYLLRKGFDEDTASTVAESLRDGGLVDDARLAEMILVSAPGRGWGPSRARQELLRRGIDRETADDALSRLYPEEDVSVALSLARKKWPSLKGEARQRESKLSGYLARRGFSTQAIIQVLSELRSAMPEDARSS